MSTQKQDSPKTGQSEGYTTHTVDDWRMALEAGGATVTREKGTGGYRFAPCPACGGGTKNKGWLRQGDKKVLAGCNSGCTFGEIAQVVFPNGPAPGRTMPPPDHGPQPDADEKEAKLRKAMRERWGNASPCTSHPYFTKKGYPADATPKGLRMDGKMLLVPMMRVGAAGHNDISGLLRIWKSKGEWLKVPVKGSDPKGAHFAINSTKAPRDRFILAEGIATALAIHVSIAGTDQDATVVTCFTAGNLLPVAVALHAKYPDASIRVAADNDRVKPGKVNPGVKYAKAAAEAVGGRWCVPRFEDTSTSPTDYDDLWRLEGPGAVRKWLDPDMAEHVDTTPPPPPPKEDLDTEPITKSWEGLLEGIQRMGWDLRWNTLNGRREWRTDAGDWIADSRREIRDKIATEISDHFRLRSGNRAIFGRDVLNTFLGRIFYDRQNDPFFDYLEGLEWDRIPRIDLILHDHFGAADDELTQFCSRYIFMTACARTVEPGCKVDEHAVFIGPYGCGKTSLVEQSLPPHLCEHFRTLEMRDNKTVAESLEGCLVAEIGEGHWLTSKDRAWIKEVLTRRDDGASIRKAWAHSTESQKRRAAIVITGDHDHVLPNDPNLRRFVVARFAHGCSCEELYADNRDQYWAEAWHRINAGESARLPRHLIKESAQRSEDHRSRVLGLDERVREVLVKVRESFGYMKSGPLLDMIRGEDHDRGGTSFSKYTDYQIWSEVKAAGWKSVRRTHVPMQPRFRAWVPINV